MGMNIAAQSGYNSARKRNTVAAGALTGVCDSNSCAALFANTLILSGLRAVAAGSHGFMCINKRRPSAEKTNKQQNDAPPDKTIPRMTSFQSTESWAGEHFLLPDSRAEARTEGTFSLTDAGTTRPHGKDQQD